MSDFNFSYKFPAVYGVQNERIFYQATVPFKALASLLNLDDDFDVNKRSQRLVDKSRAKKVAKYIQKNEDGFYVIPPLVGVIEGEYDFEEVPLDGFPNTGRMVVPMGSKITLFDGQTRATGIREALDLCKNIGHQFVSVMFFADMTLDQRKQAFHDINRTQKVPATALCIAYNGRDDFDKRVVEIVSKSYLRGHIEYEKNAVSGNNENLYSLKPFKDFFKNLIGDEFNDELSELAEEYVNKLFETINIQSWMISNNAISTAKDVREHMIVAHGVTLQALGLLGNSLLVSHPTNWKEKLESLKDNSIWYKDNPCWIGRCVNEKGKMVSNKLAVRLTSYKLKSICGLLLTPVEKKEEMAMIEVQHEV